MASTSPAKAPGVAADSASPAKVAAAATRSAERNDHLLVLAATGLGIAAALIQAGRRRRLSSGV